MKVELRFQAVSLPKNTRIKYLSIMLAAADNCLVEQS